MSRLGRTGLRVLGMGGLALAVCLPVWVLSSGDLNNAAAWANVLALPVAVLGIVLTAAGATKSDARTRAERAGPRVPPTSVYQVWAVPTPVLTFTGRPRELKKMAQAALAGNAVALVGMAGAGKTQLAAYYAHQTRRSFDLGWWIPAEDRMSVLTSLALLADRLGVGSKDGEVAAKQAIQALSARGRWLLIYDNAAKVSDLTGWVPSGPGTVVITSRDPGWDQLALRVDVAPFEAAAAAKFLCQRTGDGNQAAAAAVAGELGGLPLALEQAAAYCVTSGVTLEGYQARYRNGRARLLAAGASQHQSPVWVTLQLAVAKASRQDYAAVDLLMVLALLAEAADIPRSFLSPNRRALPRRLAAVILDPIRLDATIMVLRRLSLVTVERDVLRIHPLIQSIMRERVVEARRERWSGLPVRCIRWLCGDTATFWSIERWVACAADLLLGAMPEDPEDPRTWDEWAMLLPHASALLDRIDEQSMHAKGTGELGLRVGRYLWRRGQYGAARDLLTRVVSVLSKEMGASHPSTLSAMNILALVLSDLGESSGAGELYRQVLRVRRITLGAEHVDTLASINNLACHLRTQSDLTAAHDLHRESLAIRRRVLGEEHPKTLISMDNLALVLSDLGEFSAAEAMHRQAVSGYERVLGEDHPRTLEAMDNLAATLRRSGELAPAKELYQKAYDGRSRALGKEHPDTLISLHNLASLLMELGELRAASGFLRQVSDLRRRALGMDHPDTLASQADLDASLRDPDAASDTSSA
jgi:tetratricopeptide (TPR) repeat protein